MVGPGSCARVDDTLGPWAGSCRGGFDFTLLFEESVLSLFPLCLLLLIIPFRIFYLIKREVKVNQSLLSPSKLVCALLRLNCIYNRPSGSLECADFVCSLWRYSSCSSGALGATTDNQNQSLDSECCHQGCRCMRSWSPIIYGTSANPPAFANLESLVPRIPLIRYCSGKNVVVAKISVGNRPCHDSLGRHQGGSCPSGSD